MGQSRITPKINHPTLLGGLFFLLMATTAFFIAEGYKLYHFHNNSSLRAFTPWRSIGGCGAVGGFNTGSSLEWIGRGHSGHTLDFEITPTYSSIYDTPGGDRLGYKTSTIPVSIYAHYASLTLGFTIPFLSKTVPIDTSSFYSPTLINTTGMGDINFSLQKSIGQENPFYINIGVALPTGRINIYENSEENNRNLIPTQGQLGKGLLSANISFQKFLSQNWGFFLLGLDYSGGLLYQKTVKYSFDESVPYHKTLKYDWTWAREGFTSTNDYSTVTSDNIGLKTITCLKQGHIHHSIHAKLNIPTRRTRSVSTHRYVHINDSLVGSRQRADAYNYMRTTPPMTETQPDGSIYIKEIYPNPVIIEEITNQDGNVNWTVLTRRRVKTKSWTSLTLGYGVELFYPGRPLFLGVSFPLEFDNDNGWGIHGIAAQLGIKILAL